MKAFIGIDTSCYTTSLCLVDAKFRVLADVRKVLQVPVGKRGLSQSNMVYQHTRNLPELFERLRPLFKQYPVAGIGVTNQPRRNEHSYMPAFLAGLGYGRSLSALLGIPLYTISHQENHVLAAMRSLGEVWEEPFFALHVSGGTTELIRFLRQSAVWQATCIGGTSDVSAGQFIDRIGVALGFSFPAGVHVEQEALAEREAVKGDVVFFKDGYISFSGPESQVQREIKKGRHPHAYYCKWTLVTVWNGLVRLLETALMQGMTRLVAVGGVMSNRYIRSQMEAFCQQRGIQLVLAPPGYSSDNSAGAAFWAAWQERG